MGKNGKLLNLNSDSPKYGNKSLVTKEQENELKRRKITFSFSYFKQIPNFQIGECSKGWHIGLLERLGALGTMTPQEVLEENRGSIALRCHPIDWSAKNIPIQRKDLDWLPKEILDRPHMVARPRSLQKRMVSRVSSAACLLAPTVVTRPSTIISSLHVPREIALS